MRGIGIKRFAWVLKSLNHNFRYRVGAGRNAMLYIRQSDNEFSNERGLIDVAAFPNPTKYQAIPKFDFIDYTGRRSRGYTTFFQMLAEKNLVSVGKLSVLVPDWRDRPPRGHVLPTFKSMSEKPMGLQPGLPKGFTYSGKELKEHEKAAIRARVASGQTSIAGGEQPKRLLVSGFDLRG